MGLSGSSPQPPFVAGFELVALRLMSPVAKFARPPCTFDLAHLDSQHQLWRSGDLHFTPSSPGRSANDLTSRSGLPGRRSGCWP